MNRATQRVEQQEAQTTVLPASDSAAGSGPSPADGRGRSVQVPDIVAFAAHVADILGLPSGLADPMELRVVSFIVRRKKDGSLPDPEPVFLTSPVAPDLERIKGASGFGLAPASYLGDSETPGHRVDLRTIARRS